MKELIELTAWGMTPPKAYGAFHIIFFCGGLLLCILAAHRLKNISERGSRTLLLTVGLVLAAFELYKQLFYYYHIGGGTYQWWIFPFQLCSVPMYLCIAAALLKPGRVRDGMCYFMSTYNLMGGFIAFLEPSGLCHEYLTLTLHAFIWHMLLVFVGVFLIVSGRGCKRGEDFRRATYTFLGLCCIAFLINVIFRKVSGGTINMFFLGPSNNPLIVFKSIAQSFGWYAATVLYIPCVCFGAWLFYRVICLYYSRSVRKVLAVT